MLKTGRKYFVIVLVPLYFFASEIGLFGGAVSKPLWRASFDPIVSIDNSSTATFEKTFTKQCVLNLRGPISKTKRKVCGCLGTKFGEFHSVSRLTVICSIKYGGNGDKIGGCVQSLLERTIKDWELTILTEDMAQVVVITKELERQKNVKNFSCSAI